MRDVNLSPPALCIHDDSARCVSCVSGIDQNIELPGPTADLALEACIRCNTQVGGGIPHH